jgi:hypothetical protein
MGCDHPHKKSATVIFPPCRIAEMQLDYRTVVSTAGDIELGIDRDGRKTMIRRYANHAGLIILVMLACAYLMTAPV